MPRAPSPRCLRPPPDTCVACVTRHGAQVAVAAQDVNAVVKDLPVFAVTDRVQAWFDHGRTVEDVRTNG